jgi:hypothetical protein
MNLPDTWGSIIAQTVDGSIGEIRSAEDDVFLSIASATVSYGLDWNRDLTWSFKPSPALDRKAIIKELKQWREALRFTDVDKIVIKTKHHKVTVRFK